MVETDQLKARLTQLDSLPHQVKEVQRKLELEQESSNKAWELYEGAVAEAQQLRERLTQVEDEAKNSGARASQLEQAHADAERARRSSVDLLEARTNELREAQIFLTKIDDVSDNEVVHIVETLNGQVARIAAAVSRAPQFRFESRKDAAVVEKAVRRIEHYAWLGPSLVSSLRAADPARNNTLVQTALQAGMVSYARWLATSWEFGVMDPRGLLEGVYMAIREREPQSVAGRWRALCRTHVKALLETGEAQTQRLFKTLAGIVADVLVIYGASGTWEDVSDAVTQTFERDLHEVISLALQFQWTAGEKVVSRDFSVFAAEPDLAFDPLSMQDERADQRKTTASIRKGSVLCTTHLGLLMERKSGGKGGSGDVDSTLLLKPKVVLKSGLGKASQIASGRVVT
ncbi:hypothetical protein OH76DRAFT_1356279 [Lentinus brumalis]|uniref:Uncharacterized protein n=1 Tax=Lentinus brumalis TaxID=2498619 RepID=A0A371D1D2_9APHY|nr:hypothetical protein OH76DRAFT_1356279 [Polyporus brumalis]